MLISFISPGRPVGQHGSVFSAVGLFIQTHKTLNRITNKNRKYFFLESKKNTFEARKNTFLRLYNI